MSSEWPAIPLDELTDGTNITYGVVKPGDECPNGVKFVRGGDVIAGRILTSQLRTITTDVSQQYARTLLHGGELLVSLVGNPGEVALVPASLKGANIARQVGLVRIDPAKADANYVQYYLRSKTGRDVLLAHSKGSVQQVINLKDLKSVKVPLPPISVQRNVAVFMQALDDRITLLRETNATLEAIAQALFKSWFVDFDPVRAKMEGRTPEGMDEATAALFPDGFETSVLGEVPRGWHCAPVYELATYINGAAYKAFEPNTERRGLPIIKIAELKAGVTSQTAYSDVEMPSKYRIETGDILFSWSGNPDTSIDTFVWTHEEAWLNQHIFRVLPHSSETRSFVLQTLRYLRPVFAELARNKQTTGLGHVTVADMKRLLVVKPGSSVLTQFALVAGPIQEKIFNNARQAQVLCTLRDTLLPRLISGQLRLDENAGAIHA